MVREFYFNINVETDKIMVRRIEIEYSVEAIRLVFGLTWILHDTYEYNWEHVDHLTVSNYNCLVI